MNHSRVRTIAAFLLVSVLVWPALVSGQVTKADYERATGLRAKLQPLALNIVDRGGWLGKTPRYWYRKSVAGGSEYWIADAATLAKTIAFDHAKLAAALATATGEKVEPLNLPFFTVTFGADGKSVQFAAAGARWTCDLGTYAVKKLEGPGPRGPRGGGMTMWERGPAPEAASREAKTSPDGKWEAFVRNYNVCLRDKATKAETILSRDGSEGDYYTYESLRWAPDSKRLVSLRLRRGYHRVIQYVESSPADQLQPKYHTREYAKPGDAIDIERPVLFLVESKARIEIDEALFPNPYEGEWVVRSVDKVDETARQVYFQASGVIPGQDPYFTHAFRVNFDGADLVRLTEGEGNHSVAYSSDNAFFVDTWSRVDLAPTTEVRRVADRTAVMTVEKGDISGLLKAGWNAPEVFVAKARDGKTDIWGVVVRPMSFDPRKTYPVIEYIYAGPQGSFVPKSFQAYGNSAGGQNALGGLLFHPDFYKAGVASCGCHDNRMDKMWWNEQWMGWPLGPEYAASSNVDNAGKLQGRLLLIVGEMDTNVDPASTMQVVNALIKADKVFDLLVIPGGGHGMGGAYGERKMYDFFVRSLLGGEPPNWNAAK